MRENRRIAIAVAMSTIVATCLLPAGVIAGSSDIASDSFSRRVRSGWGAAEVGGAWQLSGPPSRFSVNGAAGMMKLGAASRSLAASLPAAGKDVDVVLPVSLNRAPQGGSVELHVDLRRDTDSNYRLNVQLGPDGSVSLSATRSVGGVNTDMGSGLRVAGLDHRAAAGIVIRARAEGSSPTLLRLRAWVGGAAEPTAWQFVVADSSPDLQNAGAIGLGARSARGVTNQPIKVRWADFGATVIETPSAPDPVFIGAGDIASCAWSGDEATAHLLEGIDGTIFAIGDNVYQNGSFSEFDACYDDSWGDYLPRTLPVAGNHEYNTANASGYFQYFGSAAGVPGKGYYSRDIGAWHVVVLNSNCGYVSCVTNSTQANWLRSDLDSSSARCTVALFHHPRFTSRGRLVNASVAPLWEILYRHDAELILNGHLHNYERFAPQTTSGASDPVHGIRQFVVGTGGATLATFDPGEPPLPNSERRNASAFGVLKLTLRPGSYDWSFVPQAGRTFTDSGTGFCH